MPGPGTISKSEEFGNAQSSAAPVNRQSQQCKTGSVVTGIVVYQLSYSIQYDGYNSSSNYIGELVLHTSL